MKHTHTHSTKPNTKTIKSFSYCFPFREEVSKGFNQPQGISFHLFGNLQRMLKYYINNFQFSQSVQSLSRVLTLCDPMNRSTPGLPVHHQLPEFTQTHVHQVSDAIHLIPCRPLLLLSPILPSIGVFSNESTLCMRWPK